MREGGHAHSLVLTGVIAFIVFVATGMVVVQHLPRISAEETASTTVKVFAGTSDGSITHLGRNARCTQSSFNTGQTYPSGTVDSSSATKINLVATGCVNGRDLLIARGFFSFDTSSIPDDAIITSAKLFVFVNGKTNNTNDGSDFVVAVAGQQASPTSLAATDYPNAGSTEGSDRIDIGTIRTNTYTGWTLNSQGMSWVSTTGYTQLALKEGHDMLGMWPNYSRSQRNALNVSLSEQSGTSRDPYLEITYVVPVVDPTPDTVPPSTPENLRVTASSSYSISISWDSASDDVGVAGYVVLRDGVEVGTTPTTIFTDTGLASSTTYLYTIIAYDAATNLSEESLPLEAATTATTVPVFEAPIGYVGCSMTLNAVNGYKTVGGTKFWPLINTYGGGGLYAWAGNLTDTNKYWAAFQQVANQYPDTHVLWWELCALGNQASLETYDNALLVLNEIKRRLPDVTIYASAQPTYDPSDHICTIAGTGGVERMTGIVNTLIANGDVLPGPVMGPLLFPDQVSTDGCHANTAGQTYMGNQLAEFFGK